MVAKSRFEVRYIVLGFSSGLYTAVDSSVKYLEINCRDWLNDERQVRNNKASEGKESKQEKGLGE